MYLGEWGVYSKIYVFESLFFVRPANVEFLRIYVFESLFFVRLASVQSLKNICFCTSHSPIRVAALWRSLCQLDCFYVSVNT